jgi:hypothetical protein
VSLIGALALGITGRSALHAHTAATDARLRLATLTDQARELALLRSSSQEQAFPVKPAGGLAGKIGTTLSKCGLPASTLQNLSPEAETVTSARCIRERATLTLSSLTLPQVGAFLNTWRGSEEGGWTISSIDLTPIERAPSAEAQRAAGASVGTDLPLRAVITLEGLFRASPQDLPKGFKP